MARIIQRSLFFAAALCTAAAFAAPPAPTASRKANQPGQAPEYQSHPPAGSDERAAEMLNKRDDQEIEKRKRDGDDDPETRDGIRIESKPDHPGEHDGKP